MSIHLNRLQSPTTIASIERNGRSFRLLENKHKGRVVARSILVLDGAWTPRVDAASYRSAQERVFDIDPIVVRAETDADRFGKKLGLNVEALVGDPSIDDRFYFETHTKVDVVRDLFSDPELRVALFEALRHFGVVVIGPPGGVVAGTGQTTISFDDEARLGAIERLAGALPAIRARPPKGGFVTIAPMLVLSVSIQFGVMAGTMSSHSSGALLGPMVGLPLLLGVATGVLLGFTVFLLIFRGRNNGVRPWGFTTGASIVLLGGLAVGLGNDLNHRLDQAKPKRYEVSVVTFRPYKKKKQSGLLEVKGLPPSLVSPDANGAQEIDHSLMPSGSCKKLEIHIGPGYFGNPWVSQVRCIGS